MKAIILAAGEGKRLWPLTEDRPKCLVKYQGRPIIDYQLEVMRACGIREIIIVTGYKKEAFKIPGVIYISNPAYDSTNMVATFFCAQKYFDDDVIVSYGDIIYEKSILEAILNSDANFSVAVSSNWRELWEKRMADPLSDAETMKIDVSGHITEIGKKPKSYDEIQGQYMGLFAIKREMVSVCQEIYRGLDANILYDGKELRNMYMTSFIQTVIDAGQRVKAVQVSGEWWEVDRLEDLKVVCDFHRACPS